MEQFEIVCLVGEGSFGRVYKANNKSSGETVALKIIRKHGRSAKELVNFHRECEIQQHLNHPNIIRMLDSFDTPSQMVVVTEFAHKDLHTILAKDGSLGEEKSRVLTWDLVSALYYLHSHRILHRDLKPQNILQDVDGKFKLCDFGLARTMTTGTHVLTSIKGTPLYMAPELMSEQPYDHQADLWSLGCIIYETLVGEPPFSTTSILHLIQLIKHERVRWPSFISQECISFLQGLLQKNPLDRLSWQNILIHEFVQGHIIILDETSVSPFTHPLTKSQAEAKELQHMKAIENKSCAIPVQEYNETKVVTEDKCNDTPTVLENETTCSSDSVKNAFDELSLRDTLKTDLGNTDVEGNISEFETDPELRKPVRMVQNLPQPIQAHYESKLKSNNLVINNMNSNIEELNNILKVQTNNTLSLTKTNIPKYSHSNIDIAKITRQSDNKTKKSFLEKRKLSQNLDNFSLKLGHTESVNKDTKTLSKSINSCNLVKTEEKSRTSEKSTGAKSKIRKDSKNINIENKPKTMSNTGQDEKEDSNQGTCEEEAKSQIDLSNEPLDSSGLGIDQPIENEEWLAFIHKTMREVLDGDLDSLKQQNLLSIIISPLRHNCVSSEVAKSVAQLLAIPLVVSRNTGDIEPVLKVYYDVKLVANLVYASVLICKRKETLKRDQFTDSDLLAFENMYLLVCHLLHSAEQFASQFCDAVVVLSAKNLIQELMIPDAKGVKLASDIIAILCSVMCCLPENAQLIEDIVLDNGLARIMELLLYQDNLLRLRTCNLVRLLGRFSCSTLQNYWCAEIRNKLEDLLEEDDVDLSMTAEETIAELKSLPFYQK
ncbi:serine/threonine-protein kinase fused-like [Ctenocephalides felis]|uniref:serine/threonine-protein kinase fused-like n=1 Tax=Ctenocephalides felis TaxID=7515 RepID=UPI000E6E20C4|nr:serine/threonine-protein kinase fused-like [Ctenocephalides felis]